MECFVLGSGGMMPMPRRRLTSVGVRTDGKIYLFDCGEGTQLPYKELHLGQRALELVAVTHLHADHCLGLPGLLMLRAQMPTPGPLTVVGPPGLERFIRHVREDLALYISYEIEIHEWTPVSGLLAYEDDLVRIYWEPVAHSVFCLGYRLEEQPRPGRFDPAAATALGVPEGPLWGKLQRGQSVETPTGATVLPAQVTGPRRRGRHIAYVTDTRPVPALERLLHHVDLAFVESMFLGAHEAEAHSKQHMTVEQATRAAQQAGARRVVLIHLSPRYEEADLAQFAEEAQRWHPCVEVGRDGTRLEVPAPEGEAQN